MEGEDECGVKIKTLGALQLMATLQQTIRTFHLLITSFLQPCNVCILQKYKYEWHKQSSLFADGTVLSDTSLYLCRVIKRIFF